jgi:hypothetical protein
VEGRTKHRRVSEELTVRGDDAVLLLLVAGFLLAALAYTFFLKGDAIELDEDETDADSWANRTVDWFASFFPGDPGDKTIGGTTPKEEVDPGDSDK